MRDKLKPVVKTEEQFLFVCHLVGPFFQRFHIERTRCMLDVSCAVKMSLVAHDLLAASSHHDTNKTSVK